LAGAAVFVLLIVGLAAKATSTTSSVAGAETAAECDAGRGLHPANTKTQAAERIQNLVMAPSG
jgi:hypothetical protein